MFWKFTYSGKYSKKYVSLILDFHETQIIDEKLVVSFSDCKNIMILMHDVEHLNSLKNNSAGILKEPFQKPIRSLGWISTDKYRPLRYQNKLVFGKANLGVHDGEKLEYGKFPQSDDKNIYLDINKLKVSMWIDAKTGLVYGTEDKLAAYRRSIEFISSGRYYDLMPIHECMIEIVNKMSAYNPQETEKFLRDELKWSKL